MRAREATGCSADGLGGIWVSCRRCGADDPVPVIRSSDRLLGLPREFTVVRCRRCGFLYTDPQPDDPTLQRHYPPRYYSSPEPPRASSIGARLRSRLRVGVLSARGYPAGPKTPGLLARAAGRLASRLLSQRYIWVPTFVPGGTLVDVGCGTGAYLTEMRDLGWKVIGVEPSRHVGAKAREETGLDIRTGTLEGAGLPDAGADVVVMRMVLEHVRDPRRTLQEVRRILKPRGRLLLSVPNSGSIEVKIFRRNWFAWELPRHLSHFTPGSLTGMLREAGLEPARLRHLVNANNLVRSLAYAKGGESPSTPGMMLRIAALVMAAVRTAGRIAAEARRPSTDRSRRSGGIAPQTGKERSADAVRRYYKEIAGTAAQSSTALTQRAVSRMLEAVGPVCGIAVDLGCGIGSNLPALQGAAERVLALDVSPSALREARRRTAGTVPVMVTDGTRLPLRSGSIHLVLCSEVLEHVLDLGAVLSEIDRVLAPGGWLLVTTPSYLNPMGLRKRRMDRRLGGPRWEPWGSHGGGMERFMTPRKLKRALPSSLGVTHRFGIDYYSAWFAPLRPTAWLANRPAARALLDERIGRFPLLRSLGMHNCVIVRKGR